MSLSLWNNCQKVASYYDEKFPGWWNWIDLTYLDMSDGHCGGRCLMTQTSGKLGDVGELKLGMKNQDVLAVHHVRDKEHCKLLDKYWATLIKQRQSKN